MLTIFAWAFGVVFVFSVIVLMATCVFLGLYAFVTWFLEWGSGGRLKFSNRSYGEPLYDPHRHC